MLSVVARLLAEVDVWEDRLSGLPVPEGTPGARPVGLSYLEIRLRCAAALDGRMPKPQTLYSYARDLRASGLVVLPRRRAQHLPRAPAPPGA